VTARLARAMTIVAVGALTAAGCGGDAKPARQAEGSPALTVWIQENQPDRVRATRADAADFTRRTGHRVDIVAIGDGQLDPMIARAAGSGSLPDAVQLPMASAHAYAAKGIIDPEAAQEVVDALGEDTFSARALSLLTSEGRVTAVPSDGWGQLLIYRKDLFERAGLRAPRTLQDIRTAAQRLDRDGMAGITLATAPDSFTAETFEHVALAAGCQLVDASGKVTLGSAACRRAFSYYVDLARNHSIKGVQDVDTTRDAYFAGRAAMIFWSPFLLDAMAGLRDDAVPSCAQCRNDPAFLARNSGLVGPLTSATGAPAQYGNISTWGIAAKGDTEGAARFVRYMMSDGYLRWLGVSPQGKYPVRFGDSTDGERYVHGWAELESGVERRAPLDRFYSTRSIASLGDGVESFQRWGFEQGAAVLLGAMSAPQPVSRVLAQAIAGRLDPATAAQRAKTAVEQVKASLE
jgi:multiple sugar transport system substrate-binding protein